MYEVAIRKDLTPAIRNDLTPAIIEPVEIKTIIEPAEIKTPWYRKKPNIEVVKDFFEYEENKMITFRVIPHAKVTGNNKRLWRSIHKMYEMYDKLNTRLEREGFKLHYREKDYLWYDVLMYQENGEKKIEFYITTSEFQATKLKRRLENRMHVTLEETNISHTVPEKDTHIQNIKFLRHDLFSLNTSVNANERQTPISSILNTVEDLQYDGDIARLSICHEVESRQKWIKNASWAREKLSKGKVPQRMNLSPQKAVPIIKTGLAGLINEVNAVLTDTLEAFSNSFFKSDKKYKNEDVLKKGYTIEDEISAKKLSGASLEKINLPVFKAHIRVAAHSPDRLTRETLAETLALSLNDIAGDNELHGVKITSTYRKSVIEELNTFKLSSKTKYDADVNLISTDEMSKLSLQLPARDLQARYADEMSVKTRVETTIPAALQKKDNLFIGHSEVKDQQIRVGLQASEKDSFYSGYTFIGKQGSGKDNAIQNFVYEGAMKHGISFVIPDWICQPGHEGMADGIRDLLPPEMIVDLDLSNEDWIVPMDLTEVIEKLGRKGGSRFAMEMIDFMDLDGLARSQKYLMEASKASGGSLSNIKRIIEDETFRVNTIKRLMKEGNLRNANELLAWGTNDDLGNKCDAILNRLNMFFGDDTLYEIFAQDPMPGLDFEKWMREGKTIIVRMPKRELGNASNTLAHWVTLKVLMTRFLMSKEDKEKHGCFIVFNEPEQVESKGLSNLMGRIATEGRKERLGSIFAFHHWGKLSKELQRNLKAGGVSQFLFASDYKSTFEESKERLAQTFTVEEAFQTPKHYAIAILNGKESIPPILVHMSPPVPPELRYDNSFYTKRHAQLYGRSWTELQKAL